MAKPILPLENLSERHYGLTSALAESYLEAARVCLNRHHAPPQEFLLQNKDEERNVVVEWTPPDDRTLSAWGNKDDATRDGAYACAIASSEHILGLFTVRRAETLTGADYYVAPVNNQIEDMEECFRLEVSGTDLDKHELQRRLKVKIRQTLEGKSNLPALAIVVGFRVKQILLQFAEEAL